MMAATPRMLAMAMATDQYGDGAVHERARGGRQDVTIVAAVFLVAVEGLLNVWVRQAGKSV